MIVGTAGHIDHGKTTLVRALTGVDTDRLPEEKRRGISIELGYAFADDGAGARVGFIDVPGHERLVHTMLSGATGIDHVLLLVAADDGPMPQTREHLAIVTLLGIARGAIVITKCDRVDAARLAQVDAEIDALVAGTPLASAPRFRTAAGRAGGASSAHPRGESSDHPNGQPSSHPSSADAGPVDAGGSGTGALRDWLLAQARETVQATDDPHGFRLAIDRVFTLAGIGTVATGTVFAGSVKVGDELMAAPGGRRMRVRSLHAQNRATDLARRGERCALNLAGVERDELSRGQWLCTPSLALQTDRLDASVVVWEGEGQPLKSGATVHLHVGSADVLARVAGLDGDSVAPGAAARVQLVLRAPVAAWHGDRLVLRDESASRTIAGGRVLDPSAPMRYRRTPQRLQELAALAQPQADARLLALMDNASLGVPGRRFAQAAGLRATPDLPADAVVAVEAGDEQWLFTPARWASLQQSLIDGLAGFHAREPDAVGVDAGRLRRLCLPRAQTPMVSRAVEALLAAGRVTRHGAFLHLPEHEVRLGEAERRVAEMLMPRIVEGRYDPPWARDLARDAGLAEPAVRTTLQRMAQRGDVFAVVKDLYYSAAAMAELAAIARALQVERGSVRAADFRDRTGLGRKRAIQILEFLDRIGVLRRAGDDHLVRADSTMFLQ